MYEFELLKLMQPSKNVMLAQALHTWFWTCDLKKFKRMVWKTCDTPKHPKQVFWVLLSPGNVNSGSHVVHHGRISCQMFNYISQLAKSKDTCWLADWEESGKELNFELNRATTRAKQRNWRTPMYHTPGEKQHILHVKVSHMKGCGRPITLVFSPSYEREPGSIPFIP